MNVKFWLNIIHSLFRFEIEFIYPTIHALKACGSTVFRMFTEFCKHHLNLIFKYFDHTPNQSPLS